MGRRNGSCFSCAFMTCLDNVSWAACIQALRRAGFVRAAESPSSVMLVSAGRSVLLRRVPILDKSILEAALRAAGLSTATFVGLLPEGLGEGLPPAVVARASASES